MSMLVMKFGGTSVGCIDAFSKAVDITLDQSKAWKHLVIVVSAMRGVTDALVRGAKLSASGDDQAYKTIVTDLKLLHYQAVNSLINSNHERKKLHSSIDKYLDEFSSFCFSIHVLGEASARAMDAITSLGERINARIMAALLCQHGVKSEAVDATHLIVTDNTFQNATPNMEATRTSITSFLSPLIKRGIIPVVTGFMGATKEGITTTLGRGGSDYTATILGDCLNAQEVWIRTDVDGVMTADPGIVPNARVIPILSYSEVSELAYFGAKVVHPRSIRPIIERGIPLWVKNTFNPSSPATLISKNPEDKPGIVKAVTLIKGLSLITVAGRGMMGIPGIAARTFGAVARQRASVLLISQASSEQSICFVILSEAASTVIQAIEEEMALELMRKDIERIWLQDDVVIVTAVGAGMRSTPGVNAQIFSTLGKNNINVIAIAQGSSECSLSIVISADSAENAVCQIHNEVIIND